MNEPNAKKNNSTFQHTPEAPNRRVSFSKPSKFSKSTSSWRLAKGSTHGTTEKSTPVPRVISLSRPSKSSLKQGSHNKTIGVCCKNITSPSKVNFYLVHFILNNAMGKTNKSEYKKHKWSGGKSKWRPVQAALLRHYGIKSRIAAWRTVQVNETLIPEPSNAQQVLNIDSTSADTRNKKQDATSSTTVDARRRLQDPTPAHLKYGTFRRLSKIRKSQEDPLLLSPRCESKPIVVARTSVTKKRSPSPTDPLKIERSSITPPVDTAPLQRPPLRRPPRRIHLSRTEPIHLDIKPKRFPSMLWC